MRTALTRRNLVLGLAAGGLGLAAGTASAQTPAGAGSGAAPPGTADYASRPVAFIHGNIPISRQELGEFLIARGGYEKLELLVNKKIIDLECQKRGVTVTEKEMEAALAEDVAALSIKKEDFILAVLPRYGKTYYEWMEDVVRPRLLLTKLCRDRVKVSDADLKIQFEREYGEKRKVQIIIWPANDDFKRVTEQWGKLRADQTEFDRVARTQANVALAASGGHIKPISRHLPAQEKIVEERAFQLRPGEVSEVLTTNQGYLVMKLHEVLPPDPTVKYDEVRPRLEKQAMDERTSEEIPKYFAELKKQAAPETFTPVPALWQFAAPAQKRQDQMQGVVPAGGTGQPMPGASPAAPMPMPMPMK